MCFSTVTSSKSGDLVYAHSLSSVGDYLMWSCSQRFVVWDFLVAK